MIDDGISALTSQYWQKLGRQFANISPSFIPLPGNTRRVLTDKSAKDS